MRKLDLLKLQEVNLEEKEASKPLPLHFESSANIPLIQQTRFLNKFKGIDQADLKEKTFQKSHQETRLKMMAKIQNLTGTTAETIHSNTFSPVGTLHRLEVPTSGFKKDAEDELVKLEQSMGDVDSVYCTNYEEQNLNPKPPFCSGTSFRSQSDREGTLNEYDSPRKQEAFLFQLYAQQSEPKEDDGMNLQNLSPRCSLDYQIARKQFSYNTSSELTGNLSPGLKVKGSFESNKPKPKKKNAESNNKALLKLKTVKEVDDDQICPKYQEDSYNSDSNSET